MLTISHPMYASDGSLLLFGGSAGLKKAQHEQRVVRFEFVAAHIHDPPREMEEWLGLPVSAVDFYGELTVSHNVPLRTHMQQILSFLI